jgi:hypothetical protein
MVKKSILAVCSVALLAVAFALPASAQDIQQGGPLTVHAKQMHITPATERPSPLVNVYTNFGAPANTNSWVGDAWLICGVTAATCGGTTAQYIASPFVAEGPNLTVKHIEVPVQLYAGTAGFELSIQQDGADCAGTANTPCGVPAPGSAYVALNAVGTFGTCCTVADAAVGVFPNVPLTVEHQYWVAVDAIPAADTATADVWDFAGKQTYYGYCVGSTAACAAWGSFYANEQPAIKVY